jgi:hypothetical protein
MIGISLTVIVCAVSAVVAANGPRTVRSCEVYNEARPLSAFEPCRYPPLRDQLGRELLAHVGRRLRPTEWMDTTCRMMTSGSGIPTG